MSRPCAVVLLLVLLPSHGLAAWMFGGGQQRTKALLEQQRQRFDVLSQHQTVARLFVRQSESQIMAEASAENRGADQRPWWYIGRVASAEDIPRAVHAQRSILLASAREQYKALRFLKDLSLAWTPDDEVDESLLRLGSYRCADCGAFNVASADNCANCGALRDAELHPRGALTLARAPRERPLALEQCAFMPETCE